MVFGQPNYRLMRGQPTMNDALRAAVFARDKAICSFSGLSVWYLDHGTAPFAHPDWVDHVRPKSRGGKDTLDNLVCASHFYNRKKLNNGSDCQYLFSCGAPTEIFYFTHGALSIQQAQLLKSHSGILVSDWYFNRAIFNLMVAVWDELAKNDATRTRDYWMAAAQKRMTAWQKLSVGVPSFEDRGLVRFPDADDVRWMLLIRTAETDGEWLRVYKALLKWARSNERMLTKFIKAGDSERRSKVADSARREGTATFPLLAAMSENARLL
jgi:hypothetical protein